MNTDFLTNDYEYTADPEGLLSDKPASKKYAARVTGNGVMYTGELSYAFSKHMTPLPSKLKTGMAKCEKPAGHWWRHPSNGWARGMHQAPDDYYGVILYSAMHDPSIAQRILKALRSTHFMLNERQPGEWRWKSWFGRMPQLTAICKAAAGEKLNIYSLIIWSAISLYGLTKPRKSQDTYTKQWAACKVMDGQNFYTDYVIKFWRWRFKKKFEHGLGQVRLEHGWSEHHPCVQYLWDDY